MTVAKNLAECSVGFRIMTFLGNSTKIEDYKLLKLSEEDFAFIKRSNAHLWNVTNLFLEAQRVTRESYSEIYYHYNIGDSDDNMVKDGFHLEESEKINWLNGFISENWVNNIIKCGYIAEQLQNSKSNKNAVLVAYYKGLEVFRSSDINSKKDAFFRLSRLSFASWQNLGFKSALKNQEESKWILNEVLKSRGLKR
ncbi:MAG: hypothetical protein ACOVPA_15775 [Rubrivivax sp.]